MLGSFNMFLGATYGAFVAAYIINGGNSSKKKSGFSHTHTHTHTQLAILILLPTLYFHIFAVSFFLYNI